MGKKIEIVLRRIRECERALKSIVQANGNKNENENENDNVNKIELFVKLNTMQ